MESPITRDASQAQDAAARGGIRIDRLVLLMGMLGLYCLVISWAFAVACLALIAYAAYDAIAGEGVGDAAGMLGGALMVLAGCGFTRWIARGFLDRRRGRAVVACVLMLAFAVFIGGSLAAGWFGSDGTAALAAQSLAAWVLAVLVISSFRNRLFWGKGR